MRVDALDRPGSYLLFVLVDRPRTLSIGGLGELLFLPGVYMYCGSALNGVRGRVGRHFRKEKKLHWHIDHLLTGAEAMFALIVYSSERCECSIAERLGRSERVIRYVKGFGSSDCGCPGHLFFCHDLDEGIMEQVKEALSRRGLRT